MILDKATYVLDAAIASSGAVSSSIDTQAAGGFGVNGLYVVIDITTILAGDATNVVFDLVSSAATGLTTPTVLASKTIAMAAGASGAVFVFGPIANNATTGRYLGIRASGDDDTLASGGYVAYLTPTIPQNVNNPVV